MHRKIKNINFMSCKNAGVAQLVEQLICNQPVGGSSPSASSKKTLLFLEGFFVLNG